MGKAERRRRSNWLGERFGVRQEKVEERAVYEYMIGRMNEITSGRMNARTN